MGEQELSIFNSCLSMTFMEGLVHNSAEKVIVPFIIGSLIIHIYVSGMALYADELIPAFARVYFNQFLWIFLIKLSVGN